MLYYRWPPQISHSREVAANSVTLNAAPLTLFHHRPRSLVGFASLGARFPTVRGHNARRRLVELLFAIGIGLFLGLVLIVSDRWSRPSVNVWLPPAPEATPTPSEAPAVEGHEPMDDGSIRLVSCEEAAL
jgi:hypothetical protein